MCLCSHLFPTSICCYESLFPSSSSQGLALVPFACPILMLWPPWVLIPLPAQSTKLYTKAWGLISVPCYPKTNGVAGHWNRAARDGLSGVSTWCCWVDEVLLFPFPPPSLLASIRLSRSAYSSYDAVMELGELTKPVEDLKTCSPCSFRLFSWPNKLNHVNWRFDECQSWSLEAKEEWSTTRGVGVTSCNSRVQSGWLTCTNSTLKVFRHLAPLEINPQLRVIIVLPYSHLHCEGNCKYCDLLWDCTVEGHRNGSCKAGVKSEVDERMGRCDWNACLSSLIRKCQAYSHIGVIFTGDYNYRRCPTKNVLIVTFLYWLKNMLVAGYIQHKCFIVLFCFLFFSISLRELKAVLPQVNFKVSSMKFLKDKFAVITC